MLSYEEAMQIIDHFHEAGDPSCDPDFVTPGLKDALVSTVAAAIKLVDDIDSGPWEDRYAEQEELREALSVLRDKN